MSARLMGRFFGRAVQDAPFLGCFPRFVEDKRVSSLSGAGARS